VDNAHKSVGKPLFSVILNLLQDLFCLGWILKLVQNDKIVNIKEPQFPGVLYIRLVGLHHRANASYTTAGDLKRRELFVKKLEAL
jgi:hypothetical protein